MKITRIEVQKKDNTRFNLYSGDEFIVSASSDSLAKYGYGEFEISEEELEALKVQEGVAFALKKALQYASKAMKTTKEIEDYLWKHKVPKEHYEEIIGRLMDLGLIDDNRYLEMYLQEKFEYSKDGSMKIKSKLYTKGYSSKDVDPHLPKFREKERENLRELVEQKVKSNPAILDNKQKFVRFLMNKGYEYSLISEALSKVYKEDFE